MKPQIIKNYLYIFVQLIKTELIVYKENIISRIIDANTLMGILLVIFNFVYPAAFNTTKTFGTFVFVGMLVNAAIFEIWPFCARFVADITGINTISYYLTLPVPAWFIFMKSALAQACKASILSLSLIPLGKILLWQQLSFAQVCWYKFTLIFISMQIFYGVFGISLWSIPNNMDNLGTIWNRIIFPLWFLGAAEFPWEVIYKLSKPFAYAALANPFLYTMEGIRSSFFGSAGFIPFWICLSMIWISILFFSWLGVMRLRRKLDFI